VFVLPDSHCSEIAAHPAAWICPDCKGVGDADGFVGVTYMLPLQHMGLAAGMGCNEGVCGIHWQ
jgi:hypothetical protein